jgi:ribonuclease HI
VERHDDNALIVYTDGSMFSKPRRQGGIGVRFVWADEDGYEQTDDYNPPGYAQADVPQMELIAVIEAFKLLLSSYPPLQPDRYEKVVVYSDAMYLVDGYAASRGSWPANKWRTRDGAPVRNAERWKELTRLVNRLGKRVDVRKVNAHKTNPHNRAADKLARASAKLPSDRVASHSKLRRKASPKRLEPGAVRMEGQRMVVHVHKAEYMPVQRCNAYRYSVESEDSPYYQELGRVYAARDISLNPGHRYEIRVNDDTNNPWIEELYGEVIQDEGGAATQDAAL